MNKFINLAAVNFCDSNSAYKLFSFIGNIYNIIKIVIPIIIILYGTVDLVKGIINPENKTSTKLFIKRLIYGISFYFLTVIITFTFSLVNNNLNSKCMEIFLNPNDTTLNSIDIDSVKDKDSCNRLGKPYIWVENQCRIDMKNDKVGE